ncbi:hypothetical protein RHMOL_Rhmol02G0035100 [Rhododendron molle]|uniref:Uncharacterized protein n=1 Tax=Rhododendron molle TaxID=49168 RepID=A0ACC0PKX3_RHOML|nr:hypothetical protein RHMOL_Rhmol02G0035100 [Rhododendron molle]
MHGKLYVIGFGGADDLWAECFDPPWPGIPLVLYLPSRPVLLDAASQACIRSIGVQLSPLRPTFHSLVPLDNSHLCFVLLNRTRYAKTYYCPIIHCTKVRVSIDVDARGTPRA